jgi:hypothetical protein
MLPTFLVVGAQKAGTTSLYGALRLHPNVAVTTPKELNFFAHEWHRGQAWYESHLGPEAERPPGVARWMLSVGDGFHGDRDSLRRRSAETMTRLFGRQIVRPTLDGADRDRVAEVLAEDVGLFRQLTELPWDGWSM